MNLPTFLHLPTKEQIKEFQQGAHYRTPDLHHILAQENRETLIEKLGGCRMLCRVAAAIGVLVIIGLLVWFLARRGYGIP